MTAPKHTDPQILEARFGAVCRRAGLSPENLAPHLQARMLLLAQYTATFDDCVRAMELAEIIFEHYARRGEPFEAGEQTVVRVGSLFSDIGKTGPMVANVEQQQLIAQMFSIEGVRNDKMSVREFFETYFPLRAEHCLVLFYALGLDPFMPMRSFWNLHVEWTFDLLRNSGVPDEAVPAAATHHLLEHVNPRAMVADDGTFTLDFGANLAFDRAEKLVILLDKYDALRRRARRDHDAAIDWLRRLLATHPRFGNDREFNALLDTMQEVFATVTHADWRA